MLRPSTAAFKVPPVAAAHWQPFPGRQRAGAASASRTSLPRLLAVLRLSASPGAFLSVPGSATVTAPGDASFQAVPGRTTGTLTLEAQLSPVAFPVHLTLLLHAPPVCCISTFSCSPCMATLPLALHWHSRVYSTRIMIHPLRLLPCASKTQRYCYLFIQARSCMSPAFAVRPSIHYLSIHQSVFVCMHCIALHSPIGPGPHLCSRCRRQCQCQGLLVMAVTGHN